MDVDGKKFTPEEVEEAIEEFANQLQLLVDKYKDKRLTLDACAELGPAFMAYVPFILEDRRRTKAFWKDKNNGKTRR